MIEKITKDLMDIIIKEFNEYLKTLKNLAEAIQLIKSSE